MKNSAWLRAAKDAIQAAKKIRYWMAQTRIPGSKTCAIILRAIDFWRSVWLSATETERSIRLGVK
jgi:hypothetical protein